MDEKSDIRNFLAETLSLERYTVDLADSASEARRKLAKLAYNCILLDVAMLELGGRELYQLIGESGTGLARKVIFMTGDMISTDTRAFIEATGNPSLTEPFSVEELRRKILSL